MISNHLKLILTDDYDDNKINSLNASINDFKKSRKIRKLLWYLFQNKWQLQMGN